MPTSFSSAIPAYKPNSALPVLIMGAGFRTPNQNKVRDFRMRAIDLGGYGTGGNQYGGMSVPMQEIYKGSLHYYNRKFHFLFMQLLFDYDINFFKQWIR